MEHKHNHEHGHEHNHEPQNGLKPLVDALSVLLHNHGKAKHTDEHGHAQFIDIQIYSEEELVNAINLAAPVIVANLVKRGHPADQNLLSSLVVQYAFYLVLVSRSLPEKGKQFPQPDNTGNLVAPPDIAGHMMYAAQSMLDAMFRSIELL